MAGYRTFDKTSLDHPSLPPNLSRSGIVVQHAPTRSSSPSVIDDNTYSLFRHAKRRLCYHLMLYRRGIAALGPPPFFDLHRVSIRSDPMRQVILNCSSRTHSAVPIFYRQQASNWKHLTLSCHIPCSGLAWVPACPGHWTLQDP